MTTKTVHLAVYNDLADWETGHAVAHIRNGEFQEGPDRYEVVTVGATADPVTTMGGLRVAPDLALADLDPADSALLILPGSSCWYTDPDALAPFTRAARAFLAAGAPVAAICGATVGLAREGLLDDRAHTSGSAEDLAATGYRGTAHYRDELAVTDGGLITAGPTAPVEFAREVFAVLGLYRPEVLAAWYKLFSAHDPSAFGALMAAEGGAA
ncbi:DJ-1/PfpI family protein [Streptomonospora nanhaiensis]|uniref:DJ-1/PfpI family protein n=1 Tax=Streptomonospora nanhaiensis TaxID=1323731 RepID=UPI001C38CB5E|nr:DJ-1/PfpI family protein [Streptomonospora nanhaiensis]MBV2363286.1 DJ-1/PfpI family protein [Streptomonospora nanhaiensis]